MLTELSQISLRYSDAILLIRWWTIELHEEGYFLTNWMIISCSRKILIHGSWTTFSKHTVHAWLCVSLRLNRNYAYVTVLNHTDITNFVYRYKERYCQFENIYLYALVIGMKF